MVNDSFGIFSKAGDNADGTVLSRLQKRLLTGNAVELQWIIEKRGPSIQSCAFLSLSDFQDTVVFDTDQEIAISSMFNPDYASKFLIC